MGSLFTDIATLNAQLQILQSTVGELSSISSTPYLPLTGGTITGSVYLDNAIPNAPNQITSKIYVDNSVNSLTASITAQITEINNKLSGLTTSIGSQSGASLSIFGGTIAGDLIIDGNLIVNGTSIVENSNTITVGSENIILNADFISGQPFTNAGIVVERGSESNVSLNWNEQSDAWQLSNDGITSYEILTTEGNTTIYNPLYYIQTPLNQFELINKLYVDTWFGILQNNISSINNLLSNNYYNRSQINNSFAALSGAIFTGEVQSQFSPVKPNDIANKIYVDTNINSINNYIATNFYTQTQVLQVALPISGGTMTGDIILPANTTNALGAITKQYVDNSVMGVITNTYNSTNLTNYLTAQQVEENYISLTGNSTISGEVLLTQVYDNANALVNKGYVDNNVNNIESNFTSFISVNGGVINGPILQYNNSTLSTSLINKEYVDNNITNLQEVIDSNYTLLDSSISDNYTTLQSNIDSNYTTLQSNIDSNYTTLQSNIDSNYTLLSDNMTTYLPLTGGTIDGNINVTSINTTSLILDGVTLTPSSIPIIKQGGFSSGKMFLYETLSSISPSTKTTYVIFDGYSNNTTNEYQNISFPVEYTIPPAVINNIDIDIDVNTTSVSIGNSTLFYTGTVIIMGI